MFSLPDDPACDSERVGLWGSGWSGSGGLLGHSGLYFPGDLLGVVRAHPSGSCSPVDGLPDWVRLHGEETIRFFLSFLKTRRVLYIDRGDFPENCAMFFVCYYACSFS